MSSLLQVFDFRSIRGKLTLLIAVASGMALLIACGAFLMNGVGALRDSKVRTLTALAEVLGSNTTAALSFNQADAAEELLASLRNRPEIAYACVLDMKAEPLAEYQPERRPAGSPTVSKVKQHAYTGSGWLAITVPVVEDSEQLGAVYLLATMQDVNAQIQRHVAIACAVIAVCLAVAIVLGFTLQNFISAPILDLATTAERISNEGDYSIRVQRSSNDELGVLYEHFNHMLQRIQDGERMLREARDQLELRVVDRTQQLQEANEQLQHRMEQRDQAMSELERSTKVVQLLQTVTVAANEADHIEMAILATLERFCEFTQWPVAHAYLPDSKSQDVWVAANLWHTVESPEFDKLRAGLKDARVGADSLAMQVLNSGRPGWGGPPPVSGNSGSLETPSLTSSFAFPVLAGANVVAVLEFFFSDLQTQTDEGHSERFDGLEEIALNVGNQLGRVFERRIAAVDLENMHRQVLDAARRAGMAEVATGVLHNVGNVLNSVNVSCAIIQERLRKSAVKTFHKTTDLIERHIDNLAAFVSEDERGRHLAPLLIKLSQQMQVDENKMGQEVESLYKNIAHIKDIIAVQQSNAKMSGFVQQVLLDELIEDAIRINTTSAARHHIDIVKDFDPIPVVLVDKQKVMQILVNLISNARHALKEATRDDKQIVVRLRRSGETRVRFVVQDNGVGIAKENLTRVFSHGFTTRRDGHGFGLHGAALFARELGGSLTLHSDGVGQGAKFTLEFPVKFHQPIPVAGGLPTALSDLPEQSSSS